MKVQHCAKKKMLIICIETFQLSYLPLFKSLHALRVQLFYGNNHSSANFSWSKSLLIDPAFEYRPKTADPQNRIRLEISCGSLEIRKTICLQIWSRQYFSIEIWVLARGSWKTAMPSTAASWKCNTTVLWCIYRKSTSLNTKVLIFFTPLRSNLWTLKWVLANIRKNIKLHLQIYGQLILAKETAAIWVLL